MPAIVNDLNSAMPSIIPHDIAAAGRSGMAALSDDECLARLAQAIEGNDDDHLDEVARLIARLAVTIE
jgi:hypothetical protein